MSEQRITIDDNCFLCGSNWTLITSAKQECEAESCYPQEEEGEYDGHHDWHAFDSDKLECEDCGSVGWMSVDGEGAAYPNYDEQNDHNTECYIKYREGKAEERGRREGKEERDELLGMVKELREVYCNTYSGCGRDPHHTAECRKAQALITRIEKK